MRTSLRGRLLWGIIGGMVILLVVFSILLYGIIHKALTNQFDASLLSTARMLAAAIENEDHNESEEGNSNKDNTQKEADGAESIKFDIEVQMIPEFTRNGGPGFYQLQSQDGHIIASSPSLAAGVQLEAEEISENPRYHKIRLPQHKRGRSVCLWFVPRGEEAQTQFESAKHSGGLLVLVVARDATELYEKFMQLQLLLIGASVTVILLSVGIGLAVVNTALKPLNQLAGQIASVQVDTLGHPLDIAQLPSEMIPVVQKLNQLLDRLKLSFERERCFTSDVAHELRTPLAGLRSTLEVALSRQRDWPSCRESMTDCLDITRKMQGLVDKLLALARIEDGRIILTEETLPVAQLIDCCWKPFTDTARGRNIVFENRVSKQLFFRIDREYLSMALANLLENCAEYTDTGGRIWIEGLESQGHVTLTFANTGCTLSPEQAGKVFDRFWRADMSRSDTGVHCGLGLALVEKIIRNLSGSIRITSQNGVFIATMILSGNSKASNE